MKQFRFRDHRPENFSNPDLNVYLKKYWSADPPVLRAEDAQAIAPNWDEAFSQSAPLHLEIGSGNGFFLAGMAEKHKDRNWLGLEIRYKRVILCAKKIQSKHLSNARIMRYDAWMVAELFPKASLSGLYTHHPDPWMKEKKAKKRLLNRAFCSWAVSALQPGAIWRIKTDFEQHILTVLDVCEDLPFIVTGRSHHIHRDGLPWDEDIQTNYEGKFRERGEPVHALELTRK
ncbi:MAG: tRNA (guanosine(46)-N7)-methyltransferase TrmB [Myxococcota bacterium]|nr:tRNA (guanosine(46)-N7)-methyltransferase TrmB [Myxococcota bacterium]